MAMLVGNMRLVTRMRLIGLLVSVLLVLRGAGVLVNVVRLSLNLLKMDVVDGRGLGGTVDR